MVGPKRKPKGNALESKHVEVFKLNFDVVVVVVVVGGGGGGWWWCVCVVLVLVLLLLLLFSQHIPSPKVKSWLVRSTL